MVHLKTYWVGCAMPIACWTADCGPRTADCRLSPPYLHGEQNRSTDQSPIYRISYTAPTTPTTNLHLSLPFRCACRPLLLRRLASAIAPVHRPPCPKFDTEAEGLVWDRLVAELAPTALRVQDISGGCGSMYGIEIASERFRGLSMLKQQRLVNGALGDLVAQWHGVQIKTRVP
ncbi:hypothetical protein P8C59_000469 [Phyllachora maydis]|uniref:Bola-like protein n=1 Tax=Phyllachora maydis TaxID=1825666 RepID=A0AAD9MB81_9PEZI|nr:hypothetical protein P8C59_000469 [Phyllachora maydis]